MASKATSRWSPWSTTCVDAHRVEPRQCCAANKLHPRQLAVGLLLQPLVDAHRVEPKQCCAANKLHPRQLAVGLLGQPLVLMHTMWNLNNVILLMSCILGS